MRFFWRQSAQEPRDEAIAKLKARGVLVLPLAQNDARLDLGFQLAPDVKDEDLAPLQALEADAVFQINLRGTKITDASLAHLKHLTGLERLHLEKTAITDAGLAHLANLKKLAYLNLYGTPVGDAGLESLKSLTGLTQLYLWETKVTDAGVAALQAALPELKVNRGADPPKADEKGAEKQDEKASVKKNG